MPGEGSWPYLPAQCPHCHYFQAFAPTLIDDSGYEIPGFCRQPRIAMELFRPQKLAAWQSGRCPLYVARVRGSSDAS
jgi:hypothetical protein